jgi:hypothetical protein
MLHGVIPATQRVLERTGLAIDDIAVAEVNEAFAPVVLAWLRATGADPERVNVHGGAIAFGHPVGASGGPLLASLLDEMTRVLHMGLMLDLDRVRAGWPQVAVRYGVARSSRACRGSVASVMAGTSYGMGTGGGSAMPMRLLAALDLAGEVRKRHRVLRGRAEVAQLDQSLPQLVAQDHREVGALARGLFELA